MRQVHISGDTVVKTDDPARMRVEVEKTSRAYVIGKRSQLFRVPYLVDYDETQGRAVFERMPDIRGIRNGPSCRSSCLDLMRRIGASLAAIHDQLELPREMVVPLPEELRCQGPGVFLHGDFSVDNICLQGDGERVVILDWQMTHVHGGVASFGTPYFDVVWLINNLFTKPASRYIFDPPADASAEAFLMSYIATSQCGFDMDNFVAYMRRFYRSKLEMRKRSLTWKRRIMLTPGHALWLRFIRCLERNVLPSSRGTT